MVGRKQFADMNYEVKFKIQNNKRCDLTGFEEVKTAGMFDIVEIENNFSSYIETRAISYLFLSGKRYIES